MNDWARWHEGTRQLDLLAHWRGSGHLDAEAWQRGHALVDAPASGAPWRGVLERLSLWLSVALLGAAVICFVAANWDELGRFSRIFGLQAMLVLATLAAWCCGLARPAGQAALLLAGLLLGGLLALVGQTWQTGADTWQLFASWAVLLLPWLLAAQNPPMSLLWALVSNTGLFLWLDEWTGGAMVSGIVIGLFNLGLARLWLFLGRRVEGLAGRLGPRLLFTAGLFALTLAAVADVFGWQGTRGGGLVVWLVAALGVAAGSLRQRDLAVLAMAILSAVVVVTTLLARLVFDALDMSSGGLLLLTVAVLSQVAVASDRLRRLHAGWTHERT